MIKHWIVCLRQFLSEADEIINNVIVSLFGLIGMGIGLLIYAPFLVLYWILMFILDILYGCLNGFKRNKK